MPKRSNRHPPRPGRAIAGVGRVLLWSGGSLWIGHAAGSVGFHEHHAIQISLALTGRVKFRSEGSAWRDYAAAIVRSHHRHQFDGCGESVAQLFVEPETVQGRALLERHHGVQIGELPGTTVAPLVADLRRAYDSRATDETLVALGRQAIDALSGSAAPALEVDPRITRVIQWLRSHKGTSITLAEAARIVHLSPSRFRHLFIAQTGISFRAYLLWARVASAVGAAMGGMSWTDAAQEWGFADSAHLSRTCRRMFGIAPTMLLRESERAPAE